MHSYVSFVEGMADVLFPEKRLKHNYLSINTGHVNPYILSVSASSQITCIGASLPHT